METMRLWLKLVTYFNKEFVKEFTVTDYNKRGLFFAAPIPISLAKIIGLNQCQLKNYTGKDLRQKAAPIKREKNLPKIHLRGNGC